jgi:hypothetical protein
LGTNLMSVCISPTLSSIFFCRDSTQSELDRSAPPPEALRPLLCVAPGRDHCCRPCNRAHLATLTAVHHSIDLKDLCNVAEARSLAAITGEPRWKPS